MKRAEIERLLPAVFQRAQPEGSPLAALLDVMEEMHAPSERVLEQLVTFFNPRWTEERFLTMLAHWVNLHRIYPQQPFGAPSLDWSSRITAMEPGHLRELIAEAAALAQLRGTALGLRRFLEIATGQQPFELDEAVVDEHGETVPFHVRVIAPQQARVQRELIERIVELEKPAYVTYEIVFAQ
jgi:phage tail-like protein